MEKLNRIPMNSNWENIFGLTTVHKISRDVSDHNPIFLDTMENREQKNRTFRFEKNWFREEDFLSIVEKVWKQHVRSRNSLEIVRIKMKNVKNVLKGWGANIREGDKKKKQELSLELAELEELEENGCISRSQTIRKTQIQG
jgi:hypothetical protein